MSDKTEAERRALPWYDPEAIPRAESDATHCRHPDCRDTNWGGRDRIHTRGEDCPPLPTTADQPTTEPSAVERAEVIASSIRDAVSNVEMRRALIADVDLVDAYVRAVLPLLAPAPQPADGLGDLATWTPAEVAASPVGASRLIQRLAAMTQPAADTETEVQWGVLRLDGEVRTSSSEEGARRFVEQRPGLVVIKRTTTYTVSLWFGGLVVWLLTRTSDEP